MISPVWAVPGVFVPTRSGASAGARPGSAGCRLATGCGAARCRFAARGCRRAATRCGTAYACSASGQWSRCSAASTATRCRNAACCRDAACCRTPPVVGAPPGFAVELPPDVELEPPTETLPPPELGGEIWLSLPLQANATPTLDKTTRTNQRFELPGVRREPKPLPFRKVINTSSGRPGEIPSRNRTQTPTCRTQLQSTGLPSSHRLTVHDSSGPEVNRLVVRFR